MQEQIAKRLVPATTVIPIESSTFYYELFKKRGKIDRRSVWFVIRQAILAGSDKVFLILYLERETGIRGGLFLPGYIPSGWVFVKYLWI